LAYTAALPHEKSRINNWRTHPMRILMMALILIMIAGVLSMTLVGGRGSKQIAKGQPLLASSSQVMGPR
jgi:hypothetical protein